MNFKALISSSLLILTLWALQYFTPENWTDPWGLIAIKKILFMVFAVSLIQFAGEVAIYFLGSRNGTILKGFLGGLVSSTALTASLARKSKEEDASGIDLGPLTLTFLSALSAMLIEAFVLIFVGLKVVDPSLAIIFIGPAVVTVILIFREASRHENRVTLEKFEGKINFEETAKLTLLIVGILVISKILVKVFGPQSLFAFTFLLSLFEIHSSVIANVNLYDTQQIEFSLFGQLLGLSLFSGYSSKLLLIWFGGSGKFRKKALSRTLLILGALVVSWLVFSSLN